jgi:hypothetical protein
MARSQIIVGRTEKVSFPESIVDVPAKIDSGAFRSSVHVRSVKLVRRKSGKRAIRVELLGHPTSPSVYERTFTDYNRVSITNSFGNKE